MAALEKPAPHPLFKLATELGPLVIFFGAILLELTGWTKGSQAS